MSGGKRFNIWIVYSDLFTNLSTFLFLAALGVFAAMGSSNHRPGPREAAPSIRCEMPKGIIAGLTRDSLLEPIGDARQWGSVCYQYFEIKGFAFTSATNELWAFRRAGRVDGESLSKPELKRKVCSGIWRALGEQKFKDLDGNIIVHGVARGGSLWPAQRRCASLADPPPTNLLYSIKRPPLQIASAISQCLSSPQTYAGTICDRIKDCDWNRPADDTCRQAAALRDWNLAETNQCVRSAAEEQAWRIARTCEAFVHDTEGFPSTDFGEPNMSAIARFPETRPALWRRVSSNGFGHDAPRTAAASDGRIVLARNIPGSIIVELRLLSEPAAARH